VKAWHRSYKTEKGRARNAAYKYLKSLLDRAEADRLITESPCKIRNGTRWVESGLTPLPTDTEVAIMLEAAETAEARALIALCAYGGLRVSEACALRVEDISTIERDEETWWVVNVSRALYWLDGGQWQFGPTKSEEGNRSLPLPARALPHVLGLLENRPRNPEALIISKDPEGAIPWGRHNYRTAFKKPRAVSGFKGSIKDLRSYHLTSYAIAGGTLRESMKRGGHRSEKAAMRYQKLAEGRQYELAKKLG
jgi:integrase